MVPSDGSCGSVGVQEVLGGEHGAELRRRADWIASIRFCIEVLAMGQQVSPHPPRVQ